MIDKIENADLKNMQEELLKNMKMLRHTVADMLGSKSFLKGLAPGAQNGVITVYGEQFPIYITANTLAADGLPEITDDIYDEDNYLSLISDDDLLWYALVEHLAHQADLLQEDNNKYSDELVDANEEMDKLNCKLAEEIKARQGYEESLKQLRDELNAANNEINELEEDRKEANKKCTEYVKEIDKLSVDNKRLSERVKTLVIEKTNRPDTAEKVSDPDVISRMETAYTTRTLELLSRITELENENEKLSERVRTLVCEKCNDGKDLSLTLKLGEQERGTPEDKVVRMDLETALMQQQIANLNTRIAQLEEKLKSTETELTTAMNANGILKTKIAVLTDEKREAQLLAYRLTSGEMHVQFDNMKSLEHENGVLKNENIDLIQKLCQKAVDTTEKPASEIIKECVDKPDLAERLAEYAQKNNDLLERNKRLNQEMAKLRVQLNSYSGASVVNHDDMQQKITKETFAELTAKINELEEENKSLNKKKEEILDYNKKLRQEITSLRIDAGLSVADSVDGMQQISSILEPHIVSANDDMKYIITYNALNEVTERIKELETTLKDKDERINQLSKNNAALSVENKNISDLLQEADRNVRFYVREVDSLEKEIKDLQSKALLDRDDIIGENHDEEESNQCIEMDMEKQKKKREHLKHLLDLMDDLMEM